jgi:hypothetical protein
MKLFKQEGAGLGNAAGRRTAGEITDEVFQAKWSWLWDYEVEANNIVLQKSISTLFKFTYIYFKKITYIYSLKYI